MRGDNAMGGVLETFRVSCAPITPPKITRRVFSLLPVMKKENILIGSHFHFG